jgi:hypothetical protein
MMPINLWDDATVPAEVWAGYGVWIEAIRYYVKQGMRVQSGIQPGTSMTEDSKRQFLDRTVYLTVREGEVKPGESQSRPGLHIEAPNLMLQGGTIAKCKVCACVFASCPCNHRGTSLEASASANVSGVAAHIKARRTKLQRTLRVRARMFSLINV